MAEVKKAVATAKKEEAKKPEAVVKAAPVAEKKAAPAAEKKAEPAKKAAPAKAAVKKAAPAKKAAAKKAPAKKAPAKKAAVKEGFYVQFFGKDLEQSAVVKQAKEAYKAAGNKAAIESINVYVKPEESAVYYVVNGDITGKFEV